MIFKTDKQTLEDLAIFGRRSEDSIYGIFNKTATAGGASVLKDMFLYPLSDITAILKRSRAIAFFSDEQVLFPFNGALFDVCAQHEHVHTLPRL